MAYLGASDPVTIRAPRDVFAGEPVLVGRLFGVSLHAARTGTQVSLWTEGAFCLPMAEGSQFKLGDAVYFDVESRLLVARGKGLPSVGVALEDTPEGGSRLRFLIRQPRIG